MLQKIPIIIFIGMIIVISTHNPLKILVKLIADTVNGDLSNNIQRFLKDHLQEPLPDLKDLTINI